GTSGRNAAAGESGRSATAKIATRTEIVAATSMMLELSNITHLEPDDRSVGRADKSIALPQARLCADRPGRSYLSHQVVVPGTLDPKMGGGAELKGLDHVVVHVGVDAGLKKRVERRTGGTAADKPSLEISLRRIRKFTGLPDIIAVSTDQMRARVPIDLGVHD